MADQTKKFEIKILNHSGNLQHYALFSEPPPTGDSSGPQLWPPAIETLTAPKSAYGFFTISRQYAAVCSTSSGSKTDGTYAETVLTKPITLGYKGSDGKIVHGTFLKLIVEEGVPQFSDEVLETERDHGFEIQTGNFDQEEARSGNWIIGLATRPSTSGKVSILGGFAPQPAENYMIVEATTFYLVAGKFTVGSIVNVTEVSTPLKIDLSVKNSVSIVHQEDGKLDLI